MPGFTPSRDARDAARTLAALLTPHLNPLSFAGSVQRLHHMSSVCNACCPPPWISQGLHITHGITYQSEHWLPLDELRPHFYRFYRQALTFSPVLANSPFTTAVSWAGIVSRFPPFLSRFINPALLLEQLLVDADLRLKFLFWSFMPERFYGDGSDRYPRQAALIADWLRGKGGRGECVTCLDAACGDGAAAYGLARLLLEQGRQPELFRIEGWTLDPLEVWAAAHGLFPHNPVREAVFRDWTAPVFQAQTHRSMSFRAADLMSLPDRTVACDSDRFDLIICNGLLGGPIIHRPEDMRRIVSDLSRLLAPGGLLLAADHFHGGWKKNIPGETLGDVFKAAGLSVADAGEGIAGSRIPALA